MGRKAIHGIDLYTSKCGIYSCNFLWAKVCFQIGHIPPMGKVELQGSNTIPCLSHLIQLCQKTLSKVQEAHKPRLQGSMRISETT